MANVLQVKDVVAVDAALFFDAVAPKLLLDSGALADRVVVSVAGPRPRAATLDFGAGVLLEGASEDAQLFLELLEEDWKLVLGGRRGASKTAEKLKGVGDGALRALQRATIRTRGGSEVLERVARAGRGPPTAGSSSRDLFGEPILPPLVVRDAMKDKQGRLIKGRPRPQAPATAPAAPAAKAVTGDESRGAPADPVAFAAQNFRLFLERIAALAADLVGSLPTDVKIEGGMVSLLQDDAWIPMGRVAAKD